MRNGGDAVPRWLRTVTIGFVGPSASRRARQAARTALAELPDPLADDVTLVVSELVSNAVEHAGGRGELTVTVTEAGTVVDVADSDPRPLPGMSRPTADQRTGRGLLIVAALATVTVEHTPTGKVVRAVFPRP